LRSALVASDARARGHRYDPDLHAPVERPPARGVFRRAPAGPDRSPAVVAGTISVPGPIGPPGGITHFDDAPAYDVALGHLRGHWTALGDAAGSVNVGVNRIQLPAGGWSTPVHEHGRQEEIFYVL